MLHIAVIGGSGHFWAALSGIAGRADLELAAAAPGTVGEDMAGFYKAAEEHHLAPRRYGSAEALLDAEAVDVAVVNPWFCDTAKCSAMCLKRGIHVYSEKPLATELSDLSALQEVWRASNRALGAMFEIRYEPWFQAVKRSVEAGEIGEVRALHGRKSYRLGARGPLYRERALYGGTIPWVAIHAVDWVLSLGGRCLSVSALHSSRCNRDHGDLEMTAALLMQLTNGVIATVTADYLRPEGAASHGDDRLLITGTRGMVEAVGGRVYLENELPRRELPLPPAENPFLRFLGLIGAPEAEGEAQAAFEATRVCLLARVDADQKRREG